MGKVHSAISVRIICCSFQTIHYKYSSVCPLSYLYLGIIPQHHLIIGVQSHYWKCWDKISSASVVSLFPLFFCNCCLFFFFSPILILTSGSWQTMPIVCYGKWVIMKLCSKEMKSFSICQLILAKLTAKLFLSLLKLLQLIRNTIMYQPPGQNRTRYRFFQILNAS